MIKKPFLYTGLAVMLSLSAVAQDKNAIKYSQTITKERGYDHLSILASDEYEGRETGKKGAWMAAEYIKKQFQSFGLKGPVKDGADPYFQKIGYASLSLSKSVLAVNGQTKESLKDYYITPNTVSAKGFDVKANSILFAGYGLSKDSFNEYEGQNVEGKVVMIFATGDPTAPAPAAPTTGRRAPSGAGSTQVKLKYLLDNKAAGVLIINPMVDNISPQMKAALANGNPFLKTQERLKGMANASVLPTVVIGTATANQILAAANTNIEEVKKKITETMKPNTVSINIPVAFAAASKETDVRAENVLGFLEGSDPKLKNEVLVITSHYDHIGLVNNPEATDKVNNGADDDGSGTTGVLMLAEAFMKAKKAGKGPKRSILFMTVVGEEKGLLGSEWYAEHPIFPIANTITNLNIDMIGRGDDDRPGNNDFVYIIGSNMLSDDLDRIGKKANADYVNITLDEKYNNRTDPNRFYYRSDHYNFAKFGIPVIFYFNGVHKDYHQPGDEVDKIDFPMLAKRAQLVYFTAWELANGANRPVVNKNDDGTPKAK
ncbi:M28 family peptidase [Pedobacter insulae]|uniref:Peptidase family M28 n=1 Tax=Pedobacter insulae TaxID=414048 RepID=A0A1I2YYK9_9SPHI|nr:M28 family peptidase [Pedobacter insulae]SFH30712.1 Peptidase family M28 [Pedobacter insulae]